MLSTTTTLLLSCGVSASYLGSIYLVPSARVQLPPSPSSSTPSKDPSDIATPPRRDRNHPTIIKSRLVAVSLSSLSSILLFPFILQQQQQRSKISTSYLSQLPQSLQLLGFIPPKLWSERFNLVALPLGLTATLFLGSLYIQYLEGDLPGQARGGRWISLKRRFDGWRGIRNYIIAPLTEEVSFRSCIVAINYLGGYSLNRLIFITPLWFGLAHVHHAWESYLAGGRTKKALIQGCLISGFQFVYTTLFGWYATYLFLRTGSIIPPFLVHSFCNGMGLPPLGWALQVYPEKKTSLWISYIVGIAGFVYGFTRWTRPEYFGGSIYWK